MLISNPNRNNPSTKRSVQASAPGRVNLIGEHTDYNGGFVLPSAIPQRTQIQLSVRDDRRVVGMSENVQSADAQFEYLLGEEKRSGKWWDYLQGLTVALIADPVLGKKISGFDLTISSAVPLGSGLSSSAALEVAFLRAVREAFSLSAVDELSDLRIAKLGQQCENDFVGARVGIMDQMASSLAETGSALFLDTRSLEFRRIALPPGVELAVINSGIAHRNAGGDYNARRSECEAACTLLGVSLLREVNPEDLTGKKFLALPDLLRRRVKHVVTENQRVLDAVSAMEAGDAEQMGRLFKASHESMRDDYAVSIPEIDRLVEIGNGSPGVYGARLTGGGFGGSIVLLCKKGMAKQASLSVAKQYREDTSEHPTVLVP